MTDNENINNYISQVTLPNGTTYDIKDDKAARITEVQSVITNGKLVHKLTFGAGGIYVFDGSEDVTVPVYTGETL